MASSTHPRLMLALDGGGLLGLVSLGILKEIESQFRVLRGDPELRLGQVFDYIGGTSTGAIIASGLALGKTVDELRALYLDRGAEIFPRPIWNLHRRILSGFSHKFPAKGAERVLREEIGEGTMLDMLEDGRLSRTRHLMIVAHNKTTNSCWPLTTYEGAYYNNPSRSDCNLKQELWRVVRASTAAPYFFPPQLLKIDPNDSSKHFYFEDGGLTAHNNPALKLYQMATAQEYGLGWQDGERSLAIISVGKGRSDRRRGRIAHLGDNIARIAQQTPASLMSGVSLENDLGCRIIGRCVFGGKVDSEVGTLVPPAPLSEDMGRKFLYARYDADLTEKGLRIAGITANEKELAMDRVKSMALFERIGQNSADQVDLASHFGLILAG